MLGPSPSGEAYDYVVNAMYANHAAGTFLPILIYKLPNLRRSFIKMTGAYYPLTSPQLLHLLACFMCSRSALSLSKSLGLS